MKIIFTVILIVIALYIIDRFCLWLEQRGWLYYRKIKPERGVVGNALLELQSFLNPSTRNIIEMKRTEGKIKKSDSDAPSDPIK